jgi:hypothetical protein
MTSAGTVNWCLLVSLTEAWGVFIPYIIGSALLIVNVRQELTAGLVVFGAPGGHLLEDGQEVVAFGGESVFGAGRDLGEAGAGDDALVLQVVETLGQGARVDAADGFF